MNLEIVVGYGWIFGFPLIVYFMNRYFKTRNGGVPFPQVYISGIFFYLVGFYPAFTLII